MIEQASQFVYHVNGFLFIFFLILVALAILVGACVFGRRLLGWAWGKLGNLLHKRL